MQPQAREANAHMSPRQRRLADANASHLQCPSCKTKQSRRSAVVGIGEREGIAIIHCRCPDCGQQWKQIGPSDGR